MFRKRIGELVLTVLNDGEVPGGVLELDGVGPAATAAVVGENRPWISVNAFAVHGAGRLAMIDTGGRALRPSTGLMLQNMAAAGISFGDIDTVLLTHMHPDHVGWLIDDDGAALFPNCRVLLADTELEFWADEANRSKVIPRALPWFDQNVAVIAAYRDRIDTFDAGAPTEVFPGVTSRDLRGHTPGHTGYLVGAGDDAVLIWGDLVQSQDLQMRFPAARIPWDLDPEQAVRSRLDLFAQVVRDGGPIVAGVHLHFPALFRIAPADIGYSLVPEPWTPYLERR